MNVVGDPYFYQPIVKDAAIPFAACIDVQTKKRHG